MLLRDPKFCEKVKRIHVEYCLVDEDLEDEEDVEEEENRDAWNIGNFFKARIHNLFFFLLRLSYNISL